MTTIVLLRLQACMLLKQTVRTASQKLVLGQIYVLGQFSNKIEIDIVTDHIIFPVNSAFMCLLFSLPLSKAILFRIWQLGSPISLPLLFDTSFPSLEDEQSGSMRPDQLFIVPYWTHCLLTKGHVPKCCESTFCCTGKTLYVFSCNFYNISWLNNAKTCPSIPTIFQPWVFEKLARRYESLISTNAVYSYFLYA